MSTPFQVCIDADDPHLLVRFWAAALGYEVEDNEPLIGRLADAGMVTEADWTTIDGRRAFRGAAAAVDPAGVGPRLLFQHVPEPKTVKNRVHWDVRLVDTTIDGLVAAGATLLRPKEDDIRWWVMADPEGNEFCAFE